ncbi:MAG TPA: hypothetical protein VGF95_08715 [Solirubrobacteraceae bacterium]
MSSEAGERGTMITHPNRDKAVVRATRAAVIVLLLVSAAMVLIVSIGGAGAEEGLMLPVQYAFVVVYLLIAYMAIRWSRGSLPVASALAVLLAIFALVGGASWFDREHAYFSSGTLNPSLLGVITFAIVPVQALLIAFAMRGFSQGWNVELERPASAIRHSAPSGSAA